MVLKRYVRKIITMYPLLQALIFCHNIEASELSKVSGLIDENKHREAAELLEKIKPEESEKPLYYLLRAKAYTGIEKFSEALTALQSAISSSTGPLKEEAMYLRASLYLKKKFYPEASTNFRLFLSQFPESKYKNEALLGLAESLRKSGQYREALKYYEKAGGCRACLYGKANTLHLLGRYSEANRLYLELLLADGGYLKTSQETLLLLGENMMLLGKRDEARKFLNSVKEPPFKYQAYLILGEMELNSGNLSESLKFFEQALQSSDHRLRQKAYLLSAEVLFALGRFDEAEKRLESLRASYPFGGAYNRSLILLSEIYRNKGRYKEAIVALKTLLLRRDTVAEALERLKKFMLEIALKEREQFLSLWRDLKRFLLDNQHISFLFEIAEYMRDSKQDFFELARWLYQNTSGDQRQKASFLLADFYSRTGETEMALGLLRDIKPESDEEIRLMAGLLMNKRDYQSAFIYLSRLKEIRIEDIPLITELSLHIKKPEIISIFEKAVSDPDAPARGYLRLADLLYEKDKKRALHYYRLALSEKKRVELDEKEIEWANYRVALINNTPPAGKNDGLSSLLIEERKTLNRLRRNL